MDEYIEKQAALDIVNGWRNQLIPTYGENDEYVKCLEMVAEHLELLHVADVRPVVHGRWIVAEPRGPHAGFRWADQYGECSECHEILEWPYKMNFCPNCGSYNGGDADG